MKGCSVRLMNRAGKCQEGKSFRILCDGVAWASQSIRDGQACKFFIYWRTSCHRKPRYYEVKDSNGDVKITETEG